MIAIDDMALRVHNTAVQHGWWKTYGETHPEQIAGVHRDAVDPTSRPIPEQLMLMVTELAEAMEEHRERDIHDVWFMEHGEKVVVTDHDEQLIRAMKGEKPEGFFVELADDVIRIMDTMVANQESLEWFLRLKDAYNKTRPYRHGGKKA